jgi:hypothetical protein
MKAPLYIPLSGTSLGFPFAPWKAFSRLPLLRTKDNGSSLAPEASVEWKGLESLAHCGTLLSDWAGQPTMLAA